MSFRLREKINDEEWALKRCRWLAEESLWALHRAWGRRGWARGVGTKARLDHSPFPSSQPVARSPQAAGVGCSWSRWGRGLPTSSHPSKTHSTREMKFLSKGLDSFTDSIFLSLWENSILTLWRQETQGNGPLTLSSADSKPPFSLLKYLSV